MGKKKTKSIKEPSSFGRNKFNKARVSELIMQRERKDEWVYNHLRISFDESTAEALYRRYMTQTKLNY